MTGMTCSADIRNPYDRTILEKRRFATLSSGENTMDLCLYLHVYNELKLVYKQFRQTSDLSRNLDNNARW